MTQEMTVVPTLIDVTTANDPGPVGVADALLRFGLAQDLRYSPGSRALFESAFTADAVFDFRRAAATCGLEIPLMTGRRTITDTILDPRTRIDTTHVVTNVRVQLGRDSATMTALVEAQHLPTDDHRRYALLKNHYEVVAVREQMLWRMRRVNVWCAWFMGDPSVIVGG